MYVQRQHLTRGSRLSRAIADDGNLTLVYGEGGGCVLDVTGDAGGIWISLRGEFQVQAGGLSHRLRRKEALVTEQDARVKAVGRGNGRWVALLGGRRVWKQLLGATSAPDTQLLPELHVADHDLRRTAVALVRTMDALDLEAALHGLAEVLAGLQAPLHAAMLRCPGRTRAKRRQVFLRLQRVRHFISACCDLEIDNDLLARMANYSTCHFLRTFNQVYGETPHAYLVDQRLLRARRLLHSSDLAITEVALASGFENRSAFSRLFRQRFGTTALATRRQIGALAFAREGCAI